MDIKVVKLYEDGFMTQAFAFGGGAAENAYDSKKLYPSSLQNYLIDTGKEIILVDTGMALEAPYSEPTEGQRIYMGKRILDYVSALEKLGYKVEDVNKILLTHKHPDHSGELKSFPNAKIYTSKTEAEALKLNGENIVKVTFKDGPYYNFENSEIIAEGIRFIPAVGHTLGNSIVIVEADNIFYMLHGDVTYTDEALKENKLSVIYEDLEAARNTLDHVRDFIKNHPTVYLSTHTPLAIENLADKKIMKLK